MNAALLEQINRASANELTGMSPIQDKLNRSVLELLDTISEVADGIGDELGHDNEQAIQIECLVSMIRVKLGFPASVHTMPQEAA